MGSIQDAPLAQGLLPMPQNFSCLSFSPTPNLFRRLPQPFRANLEREGKFYCTNGNTCAVRTSALCTQKHICQFYLITNNMNWFIILFKISLIKVYRASFSIRLPIRPQSQQETFILLRTSIKEL